MKKNRYSKQKKQKKQKKGGGWKHRVLSTRTCDCIYKEVYKVAMEQGLPTLPEHLSSPRILVGFVLLDLQFYVYVLQIVVCPFVLFLLVIVVSVLHRFTNSDYPFAIFKLFLQFRYIVLERYQGNGSQFIKAFISQRSMSNGFIYVVDAHFIDKIEENKYPGPKCLWALPYYMTEYIFLCSRVFLPICSFYFL